MKHRFNRIKEWFNRSRKWLKGIFAAVILVFLVIALRQFELQSLLDSVRQIPTRSVAALIALQIVTQLLINIQWFQIVKSGNSFPDGSNVRMSFLEIFRMNCHAEVIHIAPAGHVGSDVLRAVQISEKGGCPGKQAAAIVATQKIFSLSALFILSLNAVSFSIGRIPFMQEAHLRLIILAISALLVVLFAGVFFLRKRLKNYIAISLKKRALFCLLAFAIWLIYPLKIYLLATQIISDVNIFYVGAAAFIAYMVAMLPIFPAGLGGFEGTMTGLLLLIGFTQSDSLVITVLFRFVTFWLVLLGSLVFIAVHKYFAQRRD